MKIIPAKKENLDKISNVEYEVNKKRYSYESEKQVMDMLGKFFNKSTFFILEDNHKIIGYISLTKSVNYGDILFIAVNKKYQGKGVGSMLIQFAEEYFKKLGCKRMKLEVLANNVEAIQFYNYHKFYVTKTYKRGKNLKLIMEKEI